MSRSPAAERAALDSRRVERVYAVLSRVYDGFFDWALGPGRRIAVTRLPIQPGQRVLEIGVGTGLSLPYYPPGCRVSGIDISEPMLEQARERAEELGRAVELRRMDARRLEYADASFDHVLAPYVISVVPEPERVMAEIARVCRPGGAVVVVNHFHSDREPLRMLEHALTPASQWIGFRLNQPLDVVLRAHGFELESVERVNLLRLWHLVVLRRTAAPRVQA
jgi:phosphatidylethanolamine/phosphatidyl-N-methylethanolamine N-methyltransferase